MKGFRRTQSSVSTKFCSSESTPSQSLYMCPLIQIQKQKLRIKVKSQPKRQFKNKTVRKTKHPDCLGQLRHSQVSWVIYNMLVGVYHNWLRLAPYIMHYLSAGKRDRLENTQKLNRNAQRERDKLMEMIKKVKTKGGESMAKHSEQQEQIYVNEEILQKIEMLSNEVKFTTHVFNGEILAKKRALKTEKQNILADSLFQEMSKNKTSYNGVKMMLMSDDVSKVAQTIVDRIAIVKYMRMNKIKIDEKMLRPLKSIFKSQKNIDYEQEMTPAKVIEKIKSKFLIKSNQNFRMGHETHPSSEAETQLKAQASEGTFENKQDECKQDSIYSIHQSEPEENDGCFEFSHKRLNTKKKIGFIADDEELQWWKRIRDSYYGDKTKKINYQIYNQRKVVLNRQHKRQKVKMMLVNLKSELDSKSKEVTEQIEKPDKDQTIKIKEKDHQKPKQMGKSKKNIGKKSHQQEKQAGKKTVRTKKGTNKPVNPKSHSSVEERFDSDEDLSSSQISIVNGKLVNRSRKLLKPARLLKKRRFKKTSNIFDKIDLENFDLELKAEDNVVNKKKKILNFFNNLQASGIITTKSIKKLVTNARRLEDEVKTSNRRRNIKRKALKQDYPATSIFVIPPADEGKEADSKPQLTPPFTFLTAFNKEALKNWIPSNYNHSNREMKLSQVQKGRFSGMDCDLNIPMIKKETKKRIEIQGFEKQKIAIDLGLSIIKKFNFDRISQVAVNVEKQNFI